jgi:hypothetical protein
MSAISGREVQVQLVPVAVSGQPRQLASNTKIAFKRQFNSLVFDDISDATSRHRETTLTPTCHLAERNCVLVESYVGQT